MREKLRIKSPPAAPAAVPSEPATPSESVQSDIKLAQYFFGERQYDEAKRACERSLALDPSISRARELLRTIVRTLTVLRQP